MGEVIVPLEELRTFVVNCMQAVGTSSNHAEALAEVLVAADHRGHFSHGLNRLDMYMADIRLGMAVSGDTRPQIISDKIAVANVDGKNLLGPVVGKFCMELAIEKARTAGIGWVTARASNHFGIAGWYSMMAAAHGLIGMAFTNTSPVVVPTRAKKGILGTSPISVAAPTSGNNDPFVLDMATSTVAVGKVEIASRKGKEIPTGWAVDQFGQETRNPDEVLHGGGLMPLGGSEESGGYKGYGLAMMVEIFSSVLSGATSSPNVRSWINTKYEGMADLGHCFVAIDPNAFAPGFEERMSDLMNTCRSLEPVDQESEVLVAGDPERQHMLKCQTLGGIPYHPNQIQYANDLADKYKVKRMSTK